MDETPSLVTLLTDYLTTFIVRSDVQAVLQSAQDLALGVYTKRETILMEIHLVLSAIFPIYIGAHASLTRPPSASPPEKSQDKEGQDDETHIEPIVEGLRPSDAIMFPIVASAVLGTLYFLIEWLQDPAVLSKFLGYYFSIIGVVGVGKMAADFLNVATSFVFPSVWSSRDTVYYIDPLLRQQVIQPPKSTETQVRHKFTEKTSPLPGFISSVQFSEITTKYLWDLRALLKKRWIFQGYIHGVFEARTKIQLKDVIGYILGLAAVTLYHANGKAWWLTNLLGFGFCYGTLQLMSATTFWTGSMVLLGLFIYDITMVFYTPLMVTVATSLDVPIKLVFPGPNRGSMLGLGDVVLPGIMVALALRFDLYLHYLSRNAPLLRPPYIDASGRWGERFWTHRLRGSTVETVADAARFKKVYFTAALVGYVFGLLTTLTILHRYDHPQPALLYLVPSVLIALWGTAVVRSDFWTMWKYTEDGSLNSAPEEAKAPREKSLSDESHNSASTATPAKVSGGVSSNGVVDKARGAGEHSPHVFLFSLSAPGSGGPKEVGVAGAS